jgi:hypothetical protein
MAWLQIEEESEGKEGRCLEALRRKWGLHPLRSPPVVNREVHSTRVISMGWRQKGQDSPDPTSLPKE